MKAHVKKAVKMLQKVTILLHVAQTTAMLTMLCLAVEYW